MGNFILMGESEPSFPPTIRVIRVTCRAGLSRRSLAKMEALPPADPRLKFPHCVLGPCILRALEPFSVPMRFVVEIEQEVDGRWIAEIPQIPGAMAYGSTREEAVARAEALGLRVLAERIEHGESSPEIEQVFSVGAA